MKRTENNHFYFTYGAEGHAYKGGWTVVEAPTRAKAEAAFYAVHDEAKEFPMSICPQFSKVYGPEFEQTAMFRDGNFGARCHERIVLTVERYTDAGDLVED